MSSNKRKNDSDIENTAKRTLDISNSDQSSQWDKIFPSASTLNELIKEFGCNTLVLKEIDYHEPSIAVARYPLVYGVLVICKPDSRFELMASDTNYVTGNDLFKVNSIVENSMMSLSVVNLLLNARTENSPAPQIGKRLMDLKKKFTTIDTADRAMAFSTSEFFRCAHNDVAKRHAQDTQSDDEIRHSIIFFPRNGRICELDSLLKDPIENDIDKLDDEPIPAFLKYILKELPWRRYINKYLIDGNFDEHNFWLFALVDNVRDKYETRISELLKLSFLTKNERSELRKTEAKFQEQIKFDYEIQNFSIRKHHDYISLVAELIKILAQKKHLVDLVRTSIERSDVEDFQLFSLE